MRVMGLVGGFGLGYLAAKVLTQDSSVGYGLDVQPGEPLPLERIAALARAYRPGRLTEVELEEEDGQSVYEVELIDADGVEWELIFDAYSGDLISESRAD